MEKRTVVIIFKSGVKVSFKVANPVEIIKEIQASIETRAKVVLVNYPGNLCLVVTDISAVFLSHLEDV